MTSRAPRSSKTTLPPLPSPPATVLEWLCRRFPAVSRETWQDRMDRGLVMDGRRRPVTRSSPYIAHRQIHYFREVEAEPVSLPEIHVLHVDEHLVVADKPPFVPVVPGGAFVRTSLLYRLEEQLGLSDLAPAHRLDRATSGVVLFVRRPQARRAYGALFARRRVQRIYQAVAKVPHRPELGSLRVESRIVRGDPFFLMKEIGGEPNARTAVRLLSLQAGLGRFELRPESGKKHQLRLHMASLGWPILGDRFYPELQPEAPDDPASPLRLVARSLAFVDPVTGEDRRFVSRRDPGNPSEDR